jgi:nucleotide-binding universal stress UspA family protein
MKVLVAADSITTLNILIDEMSARSWPAGTEAQVVSIVEDGDVPLKVWREEGYGVSAVRREMTRRGEQISALAVARLQQLGISSQVVIMRGNPEFLISFAARKWPADLILIRAHNRKDFRNRLLGSVAKSVVESAPCTVEVVRARKKSADHGFRVLLATDGSVASKAAAHSITEMRLPQHTEVKVVAGSSARKIIAQAKDWSADLVVLRTSEQRGLSRLLFGSTAAAVANGAHCSVRVIRGKAVASVKGLQERRAA